MGRKNHTAEKIFGIHPAWAAGVLFRRAAVDVDEVTETFDTKV